MTTFTAYTLILEKEGVTLQHLVWRCAGAFCPEISETNRMVSYERILEVEGQAANLLYQLRLHENMSDEQWEERDRKDREREAQLQADYDTKFSRLIAKNKEFTEAIKNWNPTGALGLEHLKEFILDQLRLTSRTEESFFKPKELSVKERKIQHINTLRSELEYWQEEIKKQKELYESRCKFVEALNKEFPVPETRLAGR